MHFTSWLYPTTKKVPGAIPGTNCRFWGTNRSQLGDQDLGGEGAVLTVAAEIPVQLFDDVVDAHQPEAVARPLGGGKPPADLFLFGGGRKVGKADVELGAFHVHIHPDEAPVLRQSQACLDGVVEQIAQDDAEVQFGHPQFDRDVGVRLHRDVPGLGQRDLAVEDGVRHGVAGLDDGIHRVQVGVQLVQVVPDALHVVLGGQGFHDLDVVAVVMPPAPNLPVHVFHFPVVGLDQLPLIGRNPLVDLFGKERHSQSPMCA